MRSMRKHKEYRLAEHFDRGALHSVLQVGAELSGLDPATKGRKSLTTRSALASVVASVVSKWMSEQEEHDEQRERARRRYRRL